MEDYQLIEIKRPWIPTWFYHLWNVVCGHTLGTIQPFRWLLHCKPDPFTLKRVNGGRYQGVGNG